MRFTSTPMAIEFRDAEGYRPPRWAPQTTTRPRTASTHDQSGADATLTKIQQINAAGARMGRPQTSDGQPEMRTVDDARGANYPEFAQLRGTNERNAAFWKAQDAAAPGVVGAVEARPPGPPSPQQLNAQNAEFWRNRK